MTKPAVLLKAMRSSILAIFFTIPVIAHAQNKIGLEIGGTTEAALAFSIKAIKGKNGFSIGGSYQVGKTKGKNVDKVLSNYGQTELGRGEVFSTIDFGYIRVISKKIYLSVELSGGNKSKYINYKDDRFRGGGYHTTYGSKTILGGGATLIYKVADAIGISGGYNSIKGGTLGVGFYF